MRRRYNNLYVPSDFFYSRIRWSESFPCHAPFSIKKPSAFHIFHKSVENPNGVDNDAVYEPSDADDTFSAKVNWLNHPYLDGAYHSSQMQRSRSLFNLQLVRLNFSGDANECTTDEWILSQMFYECWRKRAWRFVASITFDQFFGWSIGQKWDNANRRCMVTVARWPESRQKSGSFDKDSDSNVQSIDWHRFVTVYTVVSCNQSAYFCLKQSWPLNILFQFI